MVYIYDVSGRILGGGAHESNDKVEDSGAASEGNGDAGGDGNEFFDWDFAYLGPTSPVNTNASVNGESWMASTNEALDLSSGNSTSGQASLSVSYNGGNTTQSDDEEVGLGNPSFAVGDDFTSQVTTTKTPLPVSKANGIYDKVMEAFNWEENYAQGKAAGEAYGQAEANARATMLDRIAQNPDSITTQQSAQHYKRFSDGMAGPISEATAQASDKNPVKAAAFLKGFLSGYYDCICVGVPNAR